MTDERKRDRESQKERQKDEIKETARTIEQRANIKSE